MHMNFFWKTNLRESVHCSQTFQREYLKARDLWETIRIIRGTGEEPNQRGSDEMGKEGKRDRTLLTD